MWSVDSSYCTASAIGHCLIRDYSLHRCFGIYQGVGKEYWNFKAVWGTAGRFQLIKSRKKDLSLWLLKLISF